MPSKIIFGFILITSLLGMRLSAQAVRHLSLELGGVGGLGAVSYEREVLRKDAFRLDMRFGFSFIPIDANNGYSFIFPVLAHGILGKSKHQLDVGIGQGFTLTTKGKFFVVMPASIGYRLSLLKGKIYLRAAYTPLISYLLDFQWQHWAGLTFGFRL